MIENVLYNATHLHFVQVSRQRARLAVVCAAGAESRRSTGEGHYKRSLDVSHGHVRTAGLNLRQRPVIHIGETRVKNARRLILNGTSCVLIIHSQQAMFRATTAGVCLA